MIVGGYIYAGLVCAKRRQVGNIRRGGGEGSLPNFASYFSGGRYIDFGQEGRCKRAASQTVRDGIEPSTYDVVLFLAKTSHGHGCSSICSILDSG